MVQIDRSDLEPVVARHDGAARFAAMLDRIGSAEELVRVLGHYIYFNSVFGAGVANLAGEIAVRHDLFRDASEPVQVLADRSVEVASDIFFAAVDEFDDRIAPHRDTHRSLAQATLKGAGAFFGFEGAELDRVTRLTPATLAAVHSVKAGYGVSLPMDAALLFGGLGFHMGSEILADEEFDVLNQYLRRAQPDLVRHLESAKVEIGGTAYPAYFWILVHTSVEVDHFEAAVKGANAALRFYSGGDPSEAKSCVLRGFERFAEVQREFITGLSLG